MLNKLVVIFVEFSDIINFGTMINFDKFSINSIPAKIAKAEMTRRRFFMSAGHLPNKLKSQLKRHMKYQPYRKQGCGTNA
jgi:hypothetical protein